MEKAASAKDELITLSRFFTRSQFISLVVQLLCLAPCFAQEYPLWFLEPDSAKCGVSEVGTGNISFHPDSTAARAIRDGYAQYAKHLSTAITGGQAFWSTENGAYWLGSDFTEAFDSTAIARAESILTPLDTLITEHFVGVWLGSADCQATGPLRRRISLKGFSQPSWLETRPESDQFFYARGVAPEYYYESSSWREAEKSAALNLARTVYTSIAAVQKVGYEGQEILREEVAVQLNDVQVAARWRDLREKLYYVLVRMPKH